MFIVFFMNLLLFMCRYYFVGNLRCFLCFYKLYVKFLFVFIVFCVCLSV